MKMISFIKAVFTDLKDSVLKAVPAISSRGAVPRWRNLGRSITPYHYMQPVLIPVRIQERSKP